MRSSRLLFASMIGLAVQHQLNAQDSYYPAPFGIEVAESPTDPQFQYAFATSEPGDALATIEELTKRLIALESKESLAETELKKLRDAKNPAVEKPKFPNVAINGVFQADAVAFNQLDSSREAYGRCSAMLDFWKNTTGPKD